MLEKSKPFMLEDDEFLAPLFFFVCCKACRDKEGIIIDVSKEAKSLSKRDIMRDVPIYGVPKGFPGCNEGEKNRKDIRCMFHMMTGHAVMVAVAGRAAGGLHPFQWITFFAGK